MTTMTISDLHKEAKAWFKKYDIGRNEQDLRFGQYICNKTGLTNPEIFNTENADEAYILLLELLYSA